ncbi:MAG: cob(I)yrinic acid a,c-diamide adenosyltransferase [Anaerolineae bacterium]|nr:cob(I)yrinic acid a,c-diamide adenosyltransferase [Anaerolineae bacterium]
MPSSGFYTRRGDDGYTNLLGPDRVPKYDARVEAYGMVDELQATLGLARASGCDARAQEILLAMQRDCHQMMAELAATEFAGRRGAGRAFAGGITSAHVDTLEEWIGELEAQVEMPTGFVVPGDSQPGAALHLARTVCRRAERLVAQLAHKGLLAGDGALRYLNRLSSLLFVMACFEDQAATGGHSTLVR